MNKRIVLVVLVAAFVFLDAQGIYSEEEKDIEDAFYKGFYLEKGKCELKSAIECYEEVIKKSKPDSKILREAKIRRGICLYGLGRYKEAKAIFEEFLQAYLKEKELSKQATVYLEMIKMKIEEEGKDKAIKKKLDTQKLSLEFNNASFKEVMGFLQNASGLNFYIHPDVIEEMEGEDVTLRLKNVVLRNILDVILDSYELSYKVYENIILIDKKDNMFPELDKIKSGKIIKKNETPESKKVANKLVTLRISPTFKEGIPISKAINFIRDVSGLNIATSCDALEKMEDASVDMSLKDIFLKTYLDLLLKIKGLTYSIKGNIIYIHSVEE